MVITPFRRRRSLAESLPPEILTENSEEIVLPPLPQEIKRSNFSFHLFFLVFWLTLIATVLLSWQMIVVQP